MSRFITLHSQNGRVWYVRATRISACSFWQTETEVYLEGDDCCIYVTEPPEKIVAMIDDDL